MAFWKDHFDEEHHSSIDIQSLSSQKKAFVVNFDPQTLYSFFGTDATSMCADMSKVLTMKKSHRYYDAAPLALHLYNIVLAQVPCDLEDRDDVISLFSCVFEEELHRSTSKAFVFS